jgi:hypothetical protein
MLVQVTRRVALGVPVTLLEVKILGHVLCALVIYLIYEQPVPLGGGGNLIFRNTSADVDGSGVSALAWFTAQTRGRFCLRIFCVEPGSRDGNGVMVC